MTLIKLLHLASLAGAVAIVLQGSPRVAAIVALLVALVQTLMVFGILSLSLKGLPLALTFAIALSGAGLVSYFQSSAKLAVAGATVVSLVGILELLQALDIV